MQVKEIQSEGLRREFRIILPATMIEAEIDRKLQKLKNSARLPGFRPGKVPLSLIRQRYGESVRGEAIEQVLQESSSQTLNERGLHPAMRPEITVTKSDGDFEYVMTFDVIPDITLMDLTSLTLQRLKAPIGNEEVEKSIHQLLKMRAQKEPLSDVQVAASGHIANVDFQGTIGGMPFPNSSGSGTDIWLDDEDNFVSGFINGIVGMRVGETKTVSVVFPEKYKRTELASKMAEFKVTLNALKQPTIPILDHEFATQLGFSDADEVRDFVAKKLELQYASASRKKLKRLLLDRLSEAHQFVAPPSLVESEFKTIWEKIMKARAENDPEFVGKNEADLEAEYRAIADRRIRLGIILAEIGRRNNIKVSDAELRQALTETARGYPGQERKVIDFYRNNPHMIEELRMPLLEEKVVNFIIDLVKIEEETVSREALFLEDDEN